jgi:hypothetical protein
MVVSPAAPRASPARPEVCDELEGQDEPLAHDRHHREQDRCLAALQARFAGPDCYVTRDRWLLMDPANPTDKLAPDLVIALGVPDRLRGEYDPVVEGKAPDLLAEYLSKDSLAADLDDKRRRYAALGVREYWVFNPWGEFAAPRIQGWALHGPEQFEPLPVEADGSIASRVLPICFAIRDDLLDVLDRDSREPLSPLRALETRLKAEQEARRHEAEARRHEAEARRHEAEARRHEAEARQQAEAEVERLRRQLEHG